GHAIKDAVHCAEPTSVAKRIRRPCREASAGAVGETAKPPANVCPSERAVSCSRIWDVETDVAGAGGSAGTGNSGDGEGAFCPGALGALDASRAGEMNAGA